MFFSSFVFFLLSNTISSISWCDEPPSIVNPKIIGGEPAIPGNFSWQVAVVSFSGDGLGLLCGGTVLNEFWVLTAAHCTNPSAKELFVLLGIKTLSDPKHTLKVRRVVRHPWYNEATIQNDIALIQTGQNLLKRGATTVCLTKDDSSLISGTSSAFVSGFGLHLVNATSSRVVLAASDVILTTSIPLIPMTKCGPEWRRLSIGTVVLSEKQLCAGDVMKGTSSGDSGGPLVVRDPYGRLVQVGITSFGASGITGMLNQRNYPGVYTRVAAYAQWIQSVTSSSTHRISPLISTFFIFLMIEAHCY